MNISNDNRNTLVTGTSKNDSIDNVGYNVTINALGGNDTISNNGSNVTINPGAGDDSVFNDNGFLINGRDLLIQYKPGDGNDFIEGFTDSSSLSISGSYYATTSSGNDIIVYVGEEKITLRSGNFLFPTGRTIVGNSKHGILVKDSYSFRNEQENVVIVGSEVDNGITNHKQNVTIAGGAGNDYIINGDAAVRSSLIGGTGDDTFYSSGASSTIDGGAGNDYIFHNSHSPEVSISGGEGSDTVQNLSSNVTINGGNGDDSIKNSGGKVKIDGGAGNDIIENNGANVSISGGKGNDTVSLASDAKNNLIDYRAGDGNDLILGFNDTSTLDIGEEHSATLIRSGNDLFVRFGDSEVTLRGAANLSEINILGLPDAILNTINTANNTSIVGGRYDDSIRNTGSNVTILAQGGNDSVWNNGDNVILNSGEGNDSIDNSGKNVRILAQGGDDSISNSGEQVSINAGDGNDLITNTAAQVTIEGGIRNDSITNSGNNVMIDGGAGNDSIQNSGDNVLIKHKAGDGSDLITGFKANSTLSISGAGCSTIKSGSDVIVYVGNDKITLRGAATLSTVNIIKTPVNVNNDKSETAISGTNLGDTIINSGSHVRILALGGDDSLNNNGLRALINGGAGNDNISNVGKYVTIEGVDGNDTIYNNAEKDLIQGGAGDDSIFNHGENITIAGENGNDTIENYINSNEVSIAGGYGNDSIQNRSSKVTISGGWNYDTILSSGTANQIYGDQNADLIILENSYKNTVNGGGGNDTIQLDSNSNNVLIQYDRYDGDDLITGFNTTSTLRLGDGNSTYSRTDSGDDVIINFAGQNITLKGAAQSDKLNIDGVTKLNVNNIRNSIELIGNRLDDSVVNDGKFVTVSTNAGKDTVSNSGLRVIIDGGANSDYISNSGSQVSIAGGADEDTISNTNGNFVSIDGGGGYDRISVSGGYKNVISGGAGNDSIYISPTERNALIKRSDGDGSDIIYGFNETATLQLGDGNDTYETLQSGNDVVVSVGSDRLTLQGAATLSNVNILGVERGQYFNNNKSNTIVSGKSGNDTIRNSGSNVTINAGAGDDFIRNRGFGTLFKYNEGDGNDLIRGFNANSTLSIAGGGVDTFKSGDNVIVTVGKGKIILRGAANLSSVNIVQAQEETTTRAGIINADDDVSVIGTAQNDNISNSGSFVTVDAQGGNDSITNTGFNGIIDAGAGNDSVVNDYGFYSSIAGGAGNDFITISSSTQVTVNAGAGDDQISIKGSDETFIEYKAGDGSDIIRGFDETTTLNIAKSGFTSSTSGNDIILSVGTNKITLEGAATLSDVNIANGTYAAFTIKNNGVICASDLPDSLVNNSYKFNDKSFSLTIDERLKNYLVTVKNEDDSVKADWKSGSATLKSGSVLEYQFTDEENGATLTSKSFGDEISFSEETSFNYGGITADVQSGGKLTAKSGKALSFYDNTSARVTAPRGYQVDVAQSNITVNDVPINALNGAGTVTVEKRGMTFEGYGAQFADLEVAKESYFGKLAPMTITYNSDDESYTLQNVAVVKTLSNDFTKLTLALGDATQANFRVNDKEFVLSSDADNLNVIEANGDTFKIQDKELDAEKIGRVTIGEQLTFSGTEIDFDGVKINYAQNKPASYSLDGAAITIDDAATVTTSDETKTITCAAGSYVINGKSFETTAALTFTADTNQIKIPLNDAATEIYFDGVKISGNSGEIVFDLTNDKISIPSGATLNVTASDEIKLNLAAGSYTVNGNEISSDNELELAADKDSVKVPLSNVAVTINGAKITGSDAAQIDNDKTIALPDGALVQNVTDNLFKLTAKNSAASFGDANKKVLLTADGTAYIGFNKANTIGVGFNALMFEQVEILGNDAWTVETSGTSGIDKITGITSGATLTTSTEYVDAGDLRFEVETDGAGDFTICGEKFTATDKTTYVVRGNSSGEIKVTLLADEFKDDDSEAAGKIYEYDTAGDYTVNGITFHAEANSKVQTITRGVEFDLSSGKFEYDGLTLEGSGTAQINRYNASLISLTNGAKVSGDDESKYFNRQFEIAGTVELIGKKFETDSQIRCGLLNIQEALEGIPTPLTGFVVDDKYVAIQNDSYDGVKIVDGKISTIEGVNPSANISGSGLANVSILTSSGGTFTINGATYNVNNDSVGVIFQTDGNGNVSDIKWQRGAVTANFENAININDQAVCLTGTTSVKVTGDDKNITEISNVAGDLVTADGKTYRKDVRVYEMGGAEKLTTSADGTIIFNGNKFETSAGETFTLDTSGNVSEIGNTQNENAIVSANVAELEASADNLATINLATTDGLEEVFGDFSEGLIVNGVFVKVTDSTNFVVKNDEENIYIETTAADIFTISGKSFETYADKTIFKLDAQGNVSEIVTDRFYLYPDEDAYLISGDFNDEIIFNGKKFCVTGTNETSIFIGEETMIGVELARNSVKVVESSDASEIAISGGGEITVGDNTFSTSDDFIGVADETSIENFIGTISGKLGGLELSGITITTDDTFSATGDGEKLTALDNLKNGSFTCDELSGLTINGAEISVANSEDITATITDGTLAIGDLKDSAIVSNAGAAVNYTVAESGEFLIGETEFKLTGDNSLTFTTDAEGTVQEISGLDKDARLQTSTGGSFIVNGTTLTAKADDIFIGLANGAARIFDPNAVIVEKNITLEADSLAIVEDTTKKISITASAGEDTIQTSGKQVNIDLKAGGATKIFATEGRVTVENYDAKTGAAFITEDIDAATFDDGKLNINSATVTFAEEPTSKLINFVDANDDAQKVFFASDGSKLDASKETANLILVGGLDSTILGGKGNNTIFASEGALIDFGDGRNVIKNFTAENKISVDAATANFSFDGENVSIKSDSGKAILESMAAIGGAAEISLVDGKAYIAQDGEDISVSETADFYFGKKSGVDFSTYQESLTIDLRKNFIGINRVTVGGGLNTLISSSRNETLTSNSNGITEFIFDAGAGHDVIQNFNFAEDKISVGAAVSNVVLKNSGDVIVQLGDEWITLEDAQGKTFQINELVALVDKNISYDAAANYFLATSKNASVIVSEESEVWLDGSHGKNFVGNIKTLDASTSDGRNTLAGNDLDNVICAGKGDASLWGSGGNDLLVGGKGKNLFFYTSGKDTIQSANDGDAVILSNVTLDQISGTNFTANGVAINFKSGGSLTIDSRADITYQLADGSQFSANHEQAVWQTK